MNKRIVTFGEVMLRLKSPGYERLLQSPVFEATFGGGEANVAVSLAQFGQQVSYITALPKNPLGEACVAFLRGRGVDVSGILRQGERMGTYYYEAGANQRPSRVVYDRLHSSIMDASPDAFTWAATLQGCKLVPHYRHHPGPEREYRPNQPASGESRPHAGVNNLMRLQLPQEFVEVRQVRTPSDDRTGEPS